MTDAFIRSARPCERDALHNLIERAYRGDSARRGWTHEADLLGGQRTDRDALDAILTDRSQRMLVALVDGAMVGCVNLKRERAGLAYLGLLTVDPERQAAGLGRRLLEAAERAAREAFAADLLEMTVIGQRSDLIAWYERRGYRATGETRPFPLDDPRFGLPTTRELHFVVLAKRLG